MLRDMSIAADVKMRHGSPLSAEHGMLNTYQDIHNREKESLSMP
jgi:hypothetical protein